MVSVGYLWFESVIWLRGPIWSYGLQTSSNAFVLFRQIDWYAVWPFQVRSWHWLYWHQILKLTFTYSQLIYHFMWLNKRKTSFWQNYSPVFRESYAIARQQVPTFSTIFLFCLWRLNVDLRPDAWSDESLRIKQETGYGLIFPRCSSSFSLQARASARKNIKIKQNRENLTFLPLVTWPLTWP